MLEGFRALQGVCWISGLGLRVWCLFIRMMFVRILIGISRGGGFHALGACGLLVVGSVGLQD